MTAPTQAAREAAERIARMLRDNPTLCERSVADVVQSACDANTAASVAILRDIADMMRAGNPAITDTIWIGPAETLLDRIEAVLEKEDARPDAETVRCAHHAARKLEETVARRLAQYTRQAREASGDDKINKGAKRRATMEALQDIRSMMAKLSNIEITNKNEMP